MSRCAIKIFKKSREHLSTRLLEFTILVLFQNSSFVNIRIYLIQQIRNIRTAISYTGNGKNVKTILVSSFQPGEGKSFVSLNLAVAYALLDKKTVILEFDLRKPKLIKNMGLTAKQGISGILAGKSKLDELLMEVPDHGGNLFVLPAGNLPPNPAELISGPNMPHLV